MTTVTMTCGDRLETQHLLSGRVAISGFDVEFTNPGPAPAPTFNDTVTKLCYDVAELTAANFVIAKDCGVPLIGLPIVPNVFYPLTGVMVHKDAGIATARDLAGKRIGVTTGYASNPGVWLRGVLTHQFDVSAEGITWFEGNADSLRGIEYSRTSRYRTAQLDDLYHGLDSGVLDALIGPGGAAQESDSVQTLSSHPNNEMLDYFSSTAVMPVNTLLVMKEDSHVRYPGLADAVVTAATEARAIYDLEEDDSAFHQGLEVGALRKMGIFPRQHGLGTHGASFRMLVQYLYEQGLIKKLWTLNELFIRS